MISVIIPAHNEEAVIGRCLGALMEGAAPGELEVIVVCNGCRDATAEAARRIGGPVQVLETPVASKVNALNLGDAAAHAFPRFFVDSDVVLPLASLRRMAEVLRSGAALAVAPRFRMELAGCTWPVRAFYAINGRLPSAREGIGGSGVYGLSQAGRERFTQFPNITADDGFVRVQFAPHERQTCEDCPSTVFAPRSLRELVAIKTRSHFGTYELRVQYPQLWANKGQGNGQALLRLACRPWLWPQLAAYGYVKVVAKRRALRRLRAGAASGWERDQSSRSVPA